MGSDTSNGETESHFENASISGTAQRLRAGGGFELLRAASCAGLATHCGFSVGRQARQYPSQGVHRQVYRQIENNVNKYIYIYGHTMISGMV